MSETKKQLENNITIPKLVEIIGNLSTIEIFELLDSLKAKFNISEESSFISSGSSNEKKEEKKDTLGSVNIKIIGLTEEKMVSGVGGKLSAYKVITEMSDDLGNKLNIIQAKNLVEAQGVLAENVNIIKAKEIQARLEEIGVNVSLISL